MARVVAILQPAIKWLPVLVVGLLVAVPTHAQFAAKNLVSDDQTVNPASIPDGHLLNGWGISSSGTSPFWVSANGSGLAVLYNVNPASDATTKAGLEVTIPGDGTVTGQAFSNVAGNFNGDTFLFVSEDGTVSGWRGALGTNAETLQTALPTNSYKGATVYNNGGNVYLYAANFAAGTVDVLKGNAGAPNLSGSFTDPNLPSGYAPFNVQNLAGTIYVTYALRDAMTGDDVAGAGHGFVDAFDTNGNLLQRIATQGALNSPWGLAIAPASFGSIAGDLLVGNFGDGTINAFNLGTLANDGPLMTAGNVPLAIDGLWGLVVGNNGSAGSSSRVYFSAGPGDESHGLFGVVQPVPEPRTWWLIASGFAAAGIYRRRFSA
ncbi:MAG TPA: TIGR03118 family protein [Lacipirellulaceae bacterium]|nr:TIGR03118 family protein [Lacipirellulaceae bacterium]